MVIIREKREKKATFECSIINAMREEERMGSQRERERGGGRGTKREKEAEKKDRSGIVKRQAENLTFSTQNPRMNSKIVKKETR